MKIKKLFSILLCVSLICFSFAGCSENSINDNNNSNTSSDNNSNNESTNSSIKREDMFTDRDYEVGYDESNSTKITFGDSILIEGVGASNDGNIVTITAEGTYVLDGNTQNGQIIVEADKTDKIQLVLNDVNINNTSTAPIYIKQADKVFITMADGSSNTLSVNGEYVAIDDNNIDSVIFSKDDLTLNGNGTLNITSDFGNAITSKDDLVITSGTYTIDVTGHGLEGKDSVRIANASCNIITGMDGIHSENTDDTEKGYVYIAGGNFEISSEDDGIHATSSVTIDDGNINISKSYEGIEGQTIDILGGIINLVASDDGLNAASGNDQSANGGMFGNKDMFASDENCYIAISGGIIKINADGDGVDSNGGVLVAAGSSGMAQNFGNDSTQCSMLVSTQNMQTKDVVLNDESGNQILKFTPEKQYNSVLISTPDIQLNKTYNVTLGDASQTVTMTDFIYGNGMGGMNPGGGQRPDGTQPPEGLKRPDGFQKPDGTQPPNNSNAPQSGNTTVPPNGK